MAKTCQSRIKLKKNIEVFFNLSDLYELFIADFNYTLYLKRYQIYNQLIKH